MRKRFIKDAPILIGVPLAVGLVLYLGGILVDIVNPFGNDLNSPLAGVIIAVVAIVILAWETGPPQEEIKSSTERKFDHHPPRQ